MMQKNSYLPDKFFGFLQHYYRAEVHRETSWRNRLDVTANWSIVVTAAIMSYVFSTSEASHSIILVNFFIVWFFLYAESRRFRYYMMLKRRTRIIEQQAFAPLFRNGNLPELDNWGVSLEKELLEAKVTMSRLESVSWRLRRNYMYIFPLLFIAWLGKLSFLAQEKSTTMISNAQILFIPGSVIFYGFLSAVIITMALAIYIPNISTEDDLP